MEATVSAKIYTNNGLLTTLFGGYSAPEKVDKKKIKRFLNKRSK